MGLRIRWPWSRRKPERQTEISEPRAETPAERTARFAKMEAELAKNPQLRLENILSSHRAQPNAKAFLPAITSAVMGMFNSYKASPKINARVQLSQLVYHRLFPEINKMGFSEKEKGRILKALNELVASLQKQL